LSARAVNVDGGGGVGDPMTGRLSADRLFDKSLKRGKGRRRETCPSASLSARKYEFSFNAVPLKACGLTQESGLFIAYGEPLNFARRVWNASTFEPAILFN